MPVWFMFDCNIVGQKTGTVMVEYQHIAYIQPGYRLSLIGGVIINFNYYNTHFIYLIARLYMKNHICFNALRSICLPASAGV